MSSFFTKLIATPFRPYLPDRPILWRQKEGENGATLGKGNPATPPTQRPILPVYVEFSVVG